MRILYILFICLIINSCVSKTTCWKIINGGKCVPIKSYEEWNRCVTPCENIIINSKTKPYKAENKKLGKAGLGTAMPVGWDVLSNFWWKRYFN